MEIVHRQNLRVLISAYACEPGKGSELGVGWNLARHLAAHHEVWVLTRANNRPAIEAELARNPVPGLRFVYHDLPSWARFWKRGQRGVQLYYYLWQLTAVPLVRRLHREVGFDVVQHVTLGKYWVPSTLAFLQGVLFVWGPVGGGESAPLALWSTFGSRGIAYEIARTVARFLGELDPLVRLTARRADLALASTPETAARLKRLGVKRVETMPQLALPPEETEVLSYIPPPPAGPVRFLSIGRLLHWKGFHLGLEAFARSGLNDAEYWIVGEGPERRRLAALARRLGVARLVHFFGQLPRERVLELFAQVHALVHPSLHDQNPTVCLEAMAAGRPVVCLDLGGPGVQVTEEVGVKVAAGTPQQAVEGMAEVMIRLAKDADLRQSMGEAGRRRVKASFIWERRVEEILQVYREILNREHCSESV